MICSLSNSFFKTGLVHDFLSQKKEATKRRLLLVFSSFLCNGNEF